MRKRLWFAGPVLAAAVAVAVAVSTTASSTAASRASGTPSAVAAAGKNGGAGKQAVTNYVKYVDGKAGAANPSLPPVTIGFVNQQGGPVVIGADATLGAELAVKYANAALDGIDGHPIALNTCFIASAEEEGTTCGQQFLAAKVPVIDEGAVAVGIQSLYSTLGGQIPVVAGVAVTTVDNPQKNAVILYGDVTHVLEPFGTYVKTVLHAKTAALVYESEPGLTTGAAAMIKSLHEEGIKVKSDGYDPSETNLIGPLTSTDASTAGAVIVYTDALGCVNIINALKQVGITDSKKIIAPPLCLNAGVISAEGDFPKWTYAIASSLYGDTTDPGLAPYEQAVTQYGNPANAPDPWNIVNFGTMLTTIRFLNQLGYGHITPAAVLKQARKFKGPVALGAPSLDCGKYKGAPAVCNDRTQFFTYDGMNKWTKAAGWLEPPK